jgi:GTP-binding protein
MVTRKKGLAKTSSTPGKTRLINFFLVNDTWRLVDLPGYGFAKVSKEQRTEFREVITDYIAKRDNLHCVFVLLDVRIPPQDIDIRFINWLGQIGVPFVLVGTKTDKISQLELSRFEQNYNRKLLETWEELPKMIFTSAIKKTGRDEILSIIDFSMH